MTAFFLSRYVDERMGSAGFQPAVAGILPGTGISVTRSARSRRKLIIASARAADRMSAGTGWKPALPRHVVT